ncbi:MULTISPECIES: hypothetical protein [unclassified Streptomyces]|uniref:hypothetical protein n=1 Tax=unclassified Streptomyces TaxID=2593676 RepID=UPI00114CF911|nr:MULTISPECIES: hypothetical protein [unclassified Streptomyces]MYT14317.1 hypothetical protein [Streptomyces sp. SID4951]
MNGDIHGSDEELTEFHHSPWPHPCTIGPPPAEGTVVNFRPYGFFGGEYTTPAVAVAAEEFALSRDERDFPRAAFRRSPFLVPLSSRVLVGRIAS